MIELNVVQGSAAWTKARLGMLVADRQRGLRRIITRKEHSHKNETTAARTCTSSWPSGRLGDPGRRNFKVTRWTERGLELVRTRRVSGLFAHQLNR